ncbi:TetR/AcrR family transcriptional regulator [Streptacidiphilus sp. PAMC 29251]
MTSVVGTGSARYRAPYRRMPGASGRALSLEVIVGRALHIVDAEGMQALSMRGLARDLGVGVATLYLYVSGKEQLVDLLLDRVYADLEHPVPDRAHWKAQLLDFIARSRESLSLHRDVARAESTAELLTSPHTLDCAETILALLRVGGMPDQAAVHGADLLVRHLTCSVAQRSRRAGRGAAGSDAEGSYHERVRDTASALPPERFPVVVSMAPVLSGGTDEEQFDFGLNVIIAGLLARNVGVAPPDQGPTPGQGPPARGSAVQGSGSPCWR